MIEYLTEAGELEDGHVCYHSARGIKVNGYNIQEYTYYISVQNS